MVLGGDVWGKFVMCFEINPILNILEVLLTIFPITLKNHNSTDYLLLCKYYHLYAGALPINTAGY